MGRREFGTVRGRWTDSAEGRARQQNARRNREQAAAKGQSYQPHYDYYTASYRHGAVTGVVKGIEYHAPGRFQTRGDARAWLDQEQALISAGKWTPPDERAVEQRRIEDERRFAPTIAEFGKEYVEGRPSGNTRSRYQQLLDYYILGEPMKARQKGKVVVITDRGLGDVRIPELSRAQVRDWWKSLPVKTRANSCHQAYALLRAMMNAAIDEELIDVNPVRVRGAGRPAKERDNEPLPLPVLYAVAYAMPPRYRLGVLLGGLGLRSGEIRALQRRDFDDDVLHVQHSVDERNWDNPIGKLKTERSDRRIIVPQALLADVKAHLRDHTQLGAKGLLFWTDDGKPVRSGHWLKLFKKACHQVAEQSDDEKVKRLLTANGGYVFHGTRVTGLTGIYRLSGGNLKAVMAVGGHTSEKTALRYQRAELDYQRAIMEAQSQEIQEQVFGKVAVEDG
jgi:integrase